MAKKTVAGKGGRKKVSTQSTNLQNHLVTIMIAAVIVGVTGFMMYASGFIHLDLFGLQQKAEALAVDPLPSGNLISNPWFRSVASPANPGLDGWTDPAAPNGYWSTSQKSSNPSPDGISGTSARFASGSGQGGGGVGQGGVDAYLYQVVSANPSNTTLWFFSHWVTGWIENASFIIYGGESPEGPWTQVWQPLQVTAATTSDHIWTKTSLLSHQISVGYPYYKVEAAGRYPADRDQGFKFTGTFFTANNGEVPTIGSPVPTILPSGSPSPSTRPTATPNPTGTPAPTVVPSPSPTTVPGNVAPTITTDTLAPAKYGTNYRSRILGTDPNVGDTLQMSILSGPQGLTISGCTFGTSKGTKTITCNVTGPAPAPGTYTVEVGLSDQTGALVTKLYELLVTTGTTSGAKR